jgi:hypothetical protein
MKHGNVGGENGCLMTTNNPPGLGAEFRAGPQLTKESVSFYTVLQPRHLLTDRNNK